MRNHRRVRGAFSHLDAFHGFRKRTDLIDFDQDRVGDAFLNAFFQTGAVGDEKIIADELNFFAQLLREMFPADVIFLVHAVFDRYDRVLANEIRVVCNEFLGGTFHAFPDEIVNAVFVKFRSGRVEREHDVFARTETGAFNSGQNQLNRRFVRRQVRREAALIADRGNETLFFQNDFQRMVNIGAHAQAFGEGFRADRHDHEFLNIDVVIRVHAAVQNIHHRHGHFAGVDAAEIAIERQMASGRAGACHRHGNAQGRVRAEFALIVRTVQTAHDRIDQNLLGYRQAD